MLTFYIHAKSRKDFKSYEEYTESFESFQDLEEWTIKNQIIDLDDFEVFHEEKRIWKYSSFLAFQSGSIDYELLRLMQGESYFSSVIESGWKSWQWEAKALSSQMVFDFTSKEKSAKKDFLEWALSI